MIYFLGDSHAPRILKQAAQLKGLPVTDVLHLADLVFVSQDTPTERNGRRNVQPIKELVDSVPRGPTLVLTSQVAPGFTRSLGRPAYHMAETLRIKDALERAMHPEQFIIGCEDPEANLPPALGHYLQAFGCPVLRMTWEEAEFAKIAINNMLAAQVEMVNRMADVAEMLNVRWGMIAGALRNDRRIGQYAYLTPGSWRASPHLLRDYVTLRAFFERVK